jgi:hypothetical protein
LRERQVTRDFLVFFGDLVGAPANALAANFHAVSADQPKNFVMRLAAERTVSAHVRSRFQSVSGAQAPFAFNAL